MSDDVATATPHALSPGRLRTSHLEARHIMNPELRFDFRA